MCVENCKTKLYFAGTVLFLSLALPGMAVARTSIGKAGEARTPDPAVETGGPLLDGALIDVTRCPTDASRMTHRCGDVLGIAIVETRSDLSNFRFIDQPTENFQVFLEPPTCDSAKHDAEIEVRRYEGRPFAVIQRVECRDSKTHKATAFHVVRGLPGFESLSANIEAVNLGRRAQAVAEAKAQQRADDHLLTVWPLLQTILRKERDLAIEQSFAERIESQRASRRKQEADQTTDIEESLSDLEDDKSTGDTDEASETSPAAPDSDEIVVIINVEK
jgi:hypothetical protein